jgi:hypothetical protein
MAPKTSSKNRPKTHTIIISRRGLFVVRPGKLSVRRRDKVKWKAVGTNVHIFFPCEELFGRSTLRVDAKKRSESLLIQVDAAERIYPYSVYCDKCNTFAVGGSDPELIVGP